jgi:hypothetical protein
MNKNITKFNAIFNELVEWLKKGWDILIFAVEQGIHDMLNRLVEYDVIHILCCSYY